MVRNPLPTSFNRDVPQHVVQKILDHDSPDMTAHYARLSDKTVREHWDKARKVGATGQPVLISPDGPPGCPSRPRNPSPTTRPSGRPRSRSSPPPKPPGTPASPR